MSDRDRRRKYYESREYGERREQDSKGSDHYNRQQQIRRNNVKKYKRRRRKRIALIVCELLVIAVLCIVAFSWSKWSKVGKTELDQSKLEAYQDTGPYTNIALFGLDSREGEIEGGVNSDTIMVVSINNDTHEARLISIYRDSLMLQDNGDYRKANSAYNYGGPEAAIAMMNRNLDLDIKNYVSVNFAALVKAIDAVGGLEIDVTEEEVDYVNGYATEIIDCTGIKSPGIDGPGKQTLDGVSATAYARIRYTEGGDFKRAERQREVLQKLVAKLQKADFVTLNRVVDEVLPLVSTSFSATDMLGFAAHATQYKIGDSKGFPFEVTTSEDVYGMEGSYVVPIDFANNVSELHQFLFDDNEYTPSDKVQSISDDIQDLTDVYAGAENLYQQ